MRFHFDHFELVNSNDTYISVAVLIESESPLEFHEELESPGVFWSVSALKVFEFFEIIHGA